MKKSLTVLVLFLSFLSWSQDEPQIANGESLCECLNGCGTSLPCNSQYSGDCPRTPTVYYKNGKRKKGTHVLVNSVGMPIPPDPDILYIEYPDGHRDYPNGFFRADVLISPNPVSELLSVSLEMTDFVMANNIQINAYEIIDHNGVVMQSENVSPCQILDTNVDNLTNGNYFIHIHLDQPLENGENIITSQFIKQ